MVGWMGRVALELVGQGALGYSFDPLVEDSRDSFTEAVKSLMYAPLPSPLALHPRHTPTPISAR